MIDRGGGLRSMTRNISRSCSQSYVRPLLRSPERGAPNARCSESSESRDWDSEAAWWGLKPKPQPWCMGAFGSRGGRSEINTTGLNCQLWGCGRRESRSKSHDGIPAAGPWGGPPYKGVAAPLQGHRDPLIKAPWPPYAGAN